MRRALLALTLGLLALPAAGAESLEDLLRSVRELGERQRQEAVERETRFRAERDQQQALLAEARAALAAEEARSADLRGRYERNEVTLAEQQAKLNEALGDLGELHGVVRQVAGDTASLLHDSLVNAQKPERLAPVSALAESRSLPPMQALEGLWLTLMEEMVASGRVERFEAPVITASGEERTLEVTRIGPFNAVSGGRFLRYLPETGRLLEPPRQPAARFANLAAALEQAKGEDEILPFPVDPTRGTLLALLVQTPDTRERIEQGGLVGYVILALGALAALIAIERFIGLGLTSRRVERQLRGDEARADNPLGRIIGVYAASPDVDAETLGLKLDEAILREVPKVQRGLGALAILAGVAPLLGLLGTVTGMIKTFQVITLYGAGDPRLMSAGISEALVTTVLGLVVAIPIVMVHSFLTARSNRIIQILDEKSAAMVAELAERRHRALAG